MPIAAERSLGALVIRADATATIGLGHVMRCLALAEAWRARGGTVHVVGQSDAATLPARVTSAGLDWYPVPAPHPDPRDLAATVQVLSRLETSGLRPSWVVVDGYHFDGAFRKTVRATSSRVVALDDHGEGLDTTDVLVSPHVGAEYRWLGDESDVVVLAGAPYVLLRSEFWAWRRWTRDVSARGRKILVTFGGSDPGDATSRVLQALDRADVELEATVVLGSANPHARSVAAAAAKLRCPVRVVCDPPDLSDLMAWADLAITGGGSTCWELAFMGVPAIVLTVASNQTAVAQALVERGAALHLGRAADVDVPEIAGAVETLCRDAARRRSLSDHARRLVDGRGAERVVDVLEALSQGADLTRLGVLRPAATGDALGIWRIANDTNVRANSFSARTIPLSEHLEWFSRVLASDTERFWVMDIGGLVCGHVRYSRTADGDAEAHVAVAPAFRGRGVGTRLLVETATAACRQLDARRARAYVFPDNIASARAFERAGFRRVGEGERQGRAYLVYERSAA